MKGVCKRYMKNRWKEKIKQLKKDKKHRKKKIEVIY